MSCNTGKNVHGLVAVTDSQWLIINNDDGQHPRYRHLDEDVVSGVDNSPVTYLLPLGHVTVVVSAARVI